jgi:hypothetical protein
MNFENYLCNNSASECQISGMGPYRAKETQVGGTIFINTRDSNNIILLSLLCFLKG